ncbi:putative aldouronate transport system permease protein [Lederbergia wuyishanensis]|uniref:Aldouronate transport system permease protein n=1 Tax=Lederbergia wuyishanensis TaxID=1347903 RepID=A0ABU0D5J8_9BACI|nr:ABC transporter permease subunit [Lederbergia wuyishanensis]MDQ0343682.1 putative aldouronate transport system permease protein [Lederbergia wuyishanensis]
MQGKLSTKASIQLKRKNKSNWFNLKSQLEIQSMVLPSIIFLIIFAYIPMYGIVIAFKDYNLFQGISGSEWIGFTHFKEFFNDPLLGGVIRNTLVINGLNLLIGFPAPIIFALLLNEVTNKRFKSIVQSISYLPHFVSWVIFGGLVLTMLSPSNGIINYLLLQLGILDEAINFIGKENYFWFILVGSEMLKGLGWGAIIYIAAISGVDQELYEAAVIDGAGRFQKIWYITIPSIMGTVVIMFIFAVSAMLNTGIEQILVLQNPLNLSASETLDTYVYKTGLQQMRYSYSTAVGLAKSVIAVILLIIANYFSKKITDNSLF